MSFINYFGQKKVSFKNYHFPAKYVLKNSNDTISSRLVNFDKNKYAFFSYTSIVGKVRFIKDNGENNVIDEDDIQYLEITDNQNIKRTFVASSGILSAETGLLELFHKGKIGLFSSYDSKTDLSYNTFARDIISVKDYLIDYQNNKIYGPYAHKLGAFSLTFIKNVEDNFEYFPDLKEMMENVYSLRRLCKSS